MAFIRTSSESYINSDAVLRIYVHFDGTNWRIKYDASDSTSAYLSGSFSAEADAKSALDILAPALSGFVDPSLLD